MSEDGELSYSQEEAILAIRDYYRFLVSLYLDESHVIEPPENGWPSISPEFQRLSGKSDEVIALIRHLPYIAKISPNGHPYDPPQATPACYWADWQAVATMILQQAAAGDTDTEGSVKAGSEGLESKNVKSHLIGLTFGGRENNVFLLDTRLGIVHWPEWYGGADYKDGYSGDPWFIDPVWAEDHVPEDEYEWRATNPAWTIPDFFKLLKIQYRKLNWIPVTPTRVISADFNFDESEEGVIPLLQGIYREHGWSLEEEGAHYRKEECLEAVKTALKEHYPDFQGWV